MLIHTIVCPKCEKGQFFVYGDTTKACQFEGCGNIIEIKYDEAIYKLIIKDFQEALARERKLVSKPEQRKLQRLLNGWQLVP
jgi:hypothetical protein